jgi:L-seryl-tRNA(Ser) seleniumtransferase
MMRIFGSKKQSLASHGLSRRDLVRHGGLLAAAGVLSNRASLGAAPAMTFDSNLYESIGVRPVINCKGTFTIISGSLSLPEVKQAMMEASRHYVHIDELMEAVGKRLADLTGAEFGMVTSGCAAALAHATAAAIAGGDPERMQRLPNLAGLKNEVIAPRYSRNVYDHAIRMLGVKFVDVENEQQLRSALGPQTALVMVLATPEDAGPFGLEPIARIAHEYKVPVLVDAAAEDLTIPNVHLTRGADLVAYSGGKALRGPQSAGILLGRKDLIKAAWLNSAPHHAFGRPMKAGKEDIMGMLAAVEMWVRRDHKAEWKQWEGWLAEIAKSVEKVSGVTTEVREPRGLSNRSPRLTIRWDTEQLGIAGEEVDRYVFNNDPRIVLASGSGNWREKGESSIGIMPWQMQPGDAPVVAAALARILSKPPQISRAVKSTVPTADVAGQWDLEIEFVMGSARHSLFFDQDGESLAGAHQGEVTSGDLGGMVEGDEVHFRSSHPYEGTRFGFDFRGKVNGDSMAGDVDLGEYGPARWSAKRHEYRGPNRRPVRPVKNV